MKITSSGSRADAVSRAAAALKAGPGRRPAAVSRAGAVGLAAAIAVGLGACGSGSSNTAAGSGNGGESADASARTLVGAGSTLVAPLISQWQPEYDKETEVAVTYGAIGSGGGIAQVTARTVDFGASDAPLSADQFKEAKGVVQIPWALAATCIAYNVEGVPNKLKLSGPVLAEIYEGKITSWDDPKIASLNPSVKLPSEKIVPVYRTDGSGDTFAFTNYLSKISPEWKTQVGVSTEVKFPVGVGGKGNSGVGGAISSTQGSIGYIAIAYVLENEFDFAEIENAAGNFPEPGVESISAAASTLKSVPANNEVSIVDPPASAPNAYPISTFTYALVPKKTAKAATMKAFLNWAITKGQQFAPKLDFAPLPAKVINADKATIDKIER